jgi:histidyl-tRNA synthetase
MSTTPTPAKVSAPRGCDDALPADIWRWQAVEAIARKVAADFAFREIRTPVMERTELFHRGVGETSDVVHKETFTFTDRGGESMTLRPEGTAGVVRAMIEHGLLNDQGAREKVYYLGSNFRFERPQKGRLRIHHQFGAEAFGVPTPEQDVECIELQMAFYARCGLKDTALRINSLGDRESKEAYRSTLVAFLTPKRDQLSEDSQRRLAENPLRILDSKDPRDIAACQGAPSALDSLTEKSRQHFARVQALLTESGLPYTVDPTLVRGFDYYTDTLWEVVASGLGAQSAVGGGGRYDNLVANLGGRPTPGVGFGSGLERLLIALEAQQVVLPGGKKSLVFLCYHGDAARAASLSLLRQLRTAGVAADMDLTGRAIKAQFKLAEKAAATHCLVTGDDELTKQTVNLKTMATATQVSVPQDQIIPRLKALMGD